MSYLEKKEEVVFSIWGNYSTCFSTNRILIYPDNKTIICHRMRWSLIKEDLSTRKCAEFNVLLGSQKHILRCDLENGISNIYVTYAELFYVVTTVLAGAWSFIERNLSDEKK